jgi:hypothetical protein
MMDTSFVIVMLVIVAALVGAGAWWVMTAGRRRAKAMEQAASRLGMEFKGNLREHPKERFAPFRLFCLEAAGTMENVMVRSHPPLWIFDYEYVIPRDQTVKQTVAVFEAPTAHWPVMVIEARKRERFTVAAGRMLTRKVSNWLHQYKEIEMSDHPAFAEQYRFLSTEPGNAVIPLLRDEFLDLLVASPGWQFETRDRWVLFYRQGDRIKPEQLHDHVQAVQRLFDAFSRQRA